MSSTDMCGPVSQQSVGYVDSVEKLDELLIEVSKAQALFGQFSQKEVDKIFTHCSMIANQNRIDLARLAIDEAGMGSLEDKTIKNHYAAEAVYDAYKNTKTCGIVSRDEAGGTAIYAEPVGVLAAIVPCTNPTSTTVFKALIALKTRNCVVFSPHPRTARCTIAAAKLIRDAAVEAGAPENCIGWIDKASVALCNGLMHHDSVAMILATGASALVKAAYSSGKPCMGGNAGNTPVVIDETADIPMAVNSVIQSKTFDHGMICASEQAIVAVESIADKVRDELKKRGAYLISDSDEKKRVGDLILNDNGALNPVAVGQPAWKLADMAGLTKHPAGCRLLVAELDNVGPEEKLSHEKLCPCLGLFVAKDYDAAVARALELVQYGGMGHTSVLYTDLNGKDKKERVTKFEATMPTGRTLVCMPTSQGALGNIYNFKQAPSLSLGCGSWGGNASAEGLQVKHLLNYKQIAERRDHCLGFRTPASIIMGKSVAGEYIQNLRASNITRVLVVSGANMRTHPLLRTITDSLEEAGIDREIFCDVGDVTTFENIQAGVAKMEQFQPTCILGVGSRQHLEAAKVLRLFYEHPNTNLQTLETKFMDISKRIAIFPSGNTKIKSVVCLPMTSGSGAEMSPFAAVMKDGRHYQIIDSSLVPDAVIVDFDFPLLMTKEEALESGFEGLTAALESYVSMIASDFTQPLSAKAVALYMENLAASVNTGDAVSRAACHRAAATAGMAVANAFHGIAHTLARQLNKCFNIPLGVAKAMVICQVIKFTAEEAPTKLGTFSQYERPKGREQYAALAGTMNLSLDEFVDKISELKKDVGIPSSIKKFGVDEAQFYSVLDDMAVSAFDDQFTGVCPRYPLVRELKQVLLDAFRGVVRYLPFDVVHDVTLLQIASTTTSTE